MINIAPSILSADLANIQGEIEKCEKAGISWLHIDVMDGTFVETITYGSPVVKSIRPKTDMILDTHLMVNDPTNQIELFAKAGSDMITIHEESNCDIGAVLKDIRNKGVKAGLTIKPATPVEKLFPYLELLDMVLIMSVEPGYGGQGFIPQSLDRISRVRREIDKVGLPIDIEVDGGINSQTAKLCIEAGANILVAGSYLFGAEDFSKATASLLG